MEKRNLEISLSQTSKKIYLNKKTTPGEFSSGEGSLIGN